MSSYKRFIFNYHLKCCIAILILAMNIWACSNNNRDNKSKPVIADIIESVYASVKIRPEVSYYPQPIRPGIIKKILVHEGDMVKKGQVLFEISPSADLTNQLSDAEINLAEAKANYLGNNNLLNNISIDILTTKGELSLDSINFKRQERLWNEKIGKKLDYDQLKLKYQNTQKKLDNLKLKYKQTQINLQNNYKKALTKTQMGRSQLEDFTINAQLDSKVYTINKEVGDFISNQEKFAELGSADKFKIEMDIDEVDITKIKLGDTVIIQIDAYNAQVFKATVSKIFPKKDDLTQTFRVESTFVTAPEQLYSGLAGEANIIVSRRKNVLTIPSEYLIDKNKVMTSDGEKTIETGLKNLKFVEVRSGIDANTILIKPNE